ncbi:MAG TPA: ABC transporter substrate-binding protein [Rubrobacteraceae bacterium]|nr:ABC transporter substrate-binding protein [Rubrobacteraceae bacterium]
MIRGFRFGVFALFALVALVGCGGGGAPQSNTPPNTLYVALEAEPPELDPNLSSAYVDRQVMASLYDKLVDIDENGEIVPMLAKSYDVSDDGKVYTFHLRDGIKFHDGTEFNAEAVKYNLDRYQEEDSVRSTEVEPIESVEAVDEYTVRVTLSEPFAPFLAVLTDRAGIMASPKAIEENNGRISKDPVGTGPFKFVERVRGDHITVEKNPDYWREGLPKIDKIEYRGIEDENVQYQNLQSGELDIIDSIPLVEFKELQESGDYNVSIEPGLGYQGVFLNVTQPPFDNKQLRQAVYRLVDRDAIVKAVLRGVGGEAGNSPFSEQSWAYSEKSDSYPEPSVEEAKKLLEEAGKPDGFSFTLKTDPSPINQQIGQVIQNNLKPAGIDVKLEQEEFGTLLDDSTNGNFQALFLGWSGRIDPDLNIYDFTVTNGDFNDSGYSNPEVDKLLNEARTTSDRARRKELYGQVMEILHEDVPYVYLFHNNQTTDFAMQPTVQGFEPYPDGILRLAGVSKEQQE